ncbi:MAG TPA: serine/threonine-protein kinase [Bdellovibrionota bacterium]|nr:serine/threonine-protein kinase [Bdellovibrionota bacterium]
MERLDHYELHETIGAGAMSTVYRATDTLSGKTVAVKLLHAHLSFGDPLARFQREAKALTSLHHRNIVGIHAFTTNDKNQWYSVLECVEGTNLAEFVGKERDIPSDLAAMMILELARGLAVAHAKGIVHRDLKPENILLSAEGILKISDFGLAHLWEGADLTLPGTRIGSPAYMSPEQIRGDKPTPKMDIFSLGVLFYLFLTGELPFQGKNRRETFDLVLGPPPPLPRKLMPHIPQSLSALCERMIAKDRPDRVTTADEVISLLETYLAEMGFTEVDEMSARYLSSTKNQRDTREAVRKWLLEAYFRAGKRAMEEGDPEKVVHLFRTILVLTGFSALPSSVAEDLQPTRRTTLPRRPLAWLWIGIGIGVAATLGFQVGNWLVRLWFG